MNNELRKIVEQRLKNAKSNALAVGTETPIGKTFTGKAELLESILDEYVSSNIAVIVSSAFAKEMYFKINEITKNHKGKNCPSIFKDDALEMVEETHALIKGKFK